MHVPTHFAAAFLAIATAAATAAPAAVVPVWGRTIQHLCNICVMETAVVLLLLLLHWRPACTSKLWLCFKYDLVAVHRGGSASV